LHLLTYHPGLPLNVQRVDVGNEGSVRLEQISYTSVDGSKVPALFAVPTARRPRACLVYQGGFGQTKEQYPELRDGAAQLGLATFTVDPRNTGARGSAGKLLAALRTPEALVKMLNDTVVDLRIGLDYLEKRPECHHKIAYLGTSLGGVLGVLLAPRDQRIKSVVLTSIGSTFRDAMLFPAEIARDNPAVPLIVPGAATNPAVLAHAVQVFGPYDPAKWIGKIAPRPLLLINGRFDPLVAPISALALAAAARPPTTVLYHDGGHDPFAPSPDEKTVTTQVADFLSRTLRLPPLR
jgi:alpha-beta hydrolase superfamily lysophospholipase